jgi:hypothetical protein
MSAQLSPTPVQKFFDNNGFPAAFGTLSTFAAGTTTPQATYVDSSQTTPNTNPIVLNFRGEANVWLDPSKSYKFVLKDFLGILIWTVDNITIGNANPSFNIIPAVDNLYTLGNTSFAWANVYVGPNHGALLDTATGNFGYYARTAREISASVTPTNFSYPPGDVRRYGADPTGSIDCTTAINNAQASNTNVYFNQTGTYRISQSMSLNRGVTFSFSAGAPLSIDLNKVVSINGQIVAGSYQIFTGSGKAQNTGDYTHGPGRFNAKWWGAVGDGVTPDDLSLQAAIDAVDQGVLYIPGGQYVIRAAHPLVKTFPGTSIEGDGYYTDLHGVGFAGSNPILTIDGTVTPHSNMYLSRLQFSCDNAGATGISAKYVNKSLFNQIAFQGMAQGIALGSHVFSNTFVEVGTSGGTTGLTFSVISDSYNNNVHLNCYFGGLGFTIACTAGGACGTNTFNGCDFEANNNIGLGALYVVTGGGGIVTATSLYGCHFENNNSAAVYFNGSAAANSIRGISISGCNIGGGFADGPHAAALSAIIVQNCNAIHVHGNYIDDFGNYAVNDLGGNSNWDLGSNYTTRVLTSFSNTGLFRVAVPYSASMTIDAATGTQFVIIVTNGTAFTINAPQNPSDGQIITLTIRNRNGGAIGAVTFNAVFALSAWTQPGGGQSRSIQFRYDASLTKWDQINQTGIDIPA